MSPTQHEEPGISVAESRVKKVLAALGCTHPNVSHRWAGMGRLGQSTGSLEWTDISRLVAHSFLPSLPYSLLNYQP